MKIVGGALIGMLTSGVALPVAGFVLGGLGRAAPCHSAPDFISGAIFGMFAFTYVLLVPVCTAGAAIGAILTARHGTVGDEPRPPGLRWPRFTLHDILLGTLLISVGLSGIFGVGAYLVPISSPAYPAVRIALLQGSSSFIGAGLMAPFQRKRLGALFGPLIGTFFYEVIMVVIVHGLEC